MTTQARLPISEHSRHAWRIADIAPDFTLIDAWALPAAGSLEDFPRLCHYMASLDAAQNDESRLSNALFSLRNRLGAIFGWDEDEHTLPIPNCSENSLYERLPGDLRSDRSTALGGKFRKVFHTDSEWAAEISNETVHAVLHLGWVETSKGRFRGQLGVYVKNRGRFGGFYMKLIEPFRHRIVYPALMRRIDRDWRAANRKATSATS